MFIIAGGGGVRAMHAYGGVTAAFDDHSDTWRNNIKGLAGVSAGAIWCLMLATGAPRQVEEKIHREFQIRPDFSRLITDYAVTDGSVLRSVIVTILNSGGLSIDSTLSDFERLLRVRFIVTATDITTGKTELLEARRFPNMRVLDAVYASCALPMLFPPLYYEEHVFVDGQVLVGLPSCFAGEENVLRIDLLPYENGREAIHDASDYVKSLMKCVMSKPLEDGCLHIPTSEISADAMAVSDEDADRLRSVGYSYVLNLLTRGKLVFWIFQTTALVSRLTDLNERFPTSFESSAAFEE